ncbi:MAG TPA: DUF6152 family protein [Vicinamibacterales bacterium]|nr:DUF6152 family protein [Vicinamibacterales bacterium]
MSAITKTLLACSMALALAAPALAHHSAAAYDTQKEVKVTGTVLQYRFANPHVYLTLQIKKDDGSTSTVEVEAGAAAVLNGLGFTKSSVAAGEVVTVVGNPARSKPDAFVLGRELYKRDGTYVPLNIASRSVYASKSAIATTIAGTWFSPRTEFGGFIGSTGRWTLTDKGKAAASSADERTRNALKDCIPVGAPALMFYPVATTIAVQRDRVVMDVDWMDSKRTMYLDGRAHPPASQTSLQGHSVGRWEGKTLVVETTNFKEHPMGLSLSMPASTQKRLIERFALSEDGKSLVYSGVLEDPVYLAKPVEWSGKWEYRPTMKPSNQKCDIEVASKFLSQ